MLLLVTTQDSPPWIQREMDAKSFRRSSIALFFACSSFASDAAVGSEVEASKLVSAIACDDFGTFVADGNPSFQRLKREQVESVVSQLSKKLWSGYDLAYLCELNQRGYQVTFCRIRFKSGSDDLLATLSMKDEKVEGFWIK